MLGKCRKKKYFKCFCKYYAVFFNYWKYSKIYLTLTFTHSFFKAVTIHTLVIHTFVTIGCSWTSFIMTDPFNSVL